MLSSHLTAPADGIDSDRIVNTAFLDDYHKCQICHSVLWKPVACKTCEKPYCKTCIDKWLNGKIEKTCPNRCKYEERNCSPLTSTLLAKLEISCIYKTDGCKQILLYDSLERHENQCDYQGKECFGCKQLYPKNFLRQHEQQCDMIKFFCYLCEEDIFQREFSQHLSACLRCRLETMRTEMVDMINKHDNNIKQRLKAAENSQIELNQHMKNLEKTISSTQKNTFYTQSAFWVLLILVIVLFFLGIVLFLSVHDMKDEVKKLSNNYGDMKDKVIKLSNNYDDMNAKCDQRNKLFFWQ
ncbi:unnamed protein product [Didymodactylos carnosus]|uniref:RING-type domain-containing protein n=1 Tax=Didymodactylos carnosus TaxID=1234261 RepID=A0A815H1Z1_9BILA|nr:unnamed protein product [Didymodactylos carnosus]CAF1427451.1 unnamed protein product [Didymodactylos carnosus]CAF4211960.1 unnamed protein product [Didymodactylos carnosus]CAF4226270.1 unnamed protein product [Didymodactylos carnosus]